MTERGDRGVVGKERQTTDGQRERDRKRVMHGAKDERECWVDGGRG